MALFGRKQQEPQDIKRKFETGDEIFRKGHSPEDVARLSQFIATIPPESWQVEVIPAEKPDTERRESREAKRVFISLREECGGAVMKTTTPNGVEIELKSSVHSGDYQQRDLYNFDRVLQEHHWRIRVFVVKVNGEYIYHIDGSDYPHDAPITYGETGFGRAACWDTYVKLDEHFFGEQRRETQREQEAQETAVRTKEEAGQEFWSTLRGG